MKVLLINSVCGIRSTGRICTDIAEVLNSKGIDCKIAYGRENVPLKYKDYAVRIGSELNVRIDGLKTRLFDNAGFNSRKATLEFIDIVKEYDPDVIHLHNLHGYYINVEILFDYLKKSGKKVVLTLHDCWSFTGHCVHFENRGCEKWKDGCHNCPAKKAYPASLFFDNSKKNYKKKKTVFTSSYNMTIVTPSNWLADLVKQSFLGKYDVKVINNGIDLDVFKPTESDFRKRNGFENKKIVLGVASAWSKSKGLYDFIKLSELLSDDYKIVLVGLTKEQMKDVPKNIFCIERTNNIKELAEIYSVADVFVNPTYSDTFPTVNIEALACGTPVITYKAGGSPEIVDEKSGIVIEKGDLNALISAIKTIDLNRENCLNRAKAFDKLISYENYVDLYLS